MSYSQQWWQAKVRQLLLIYKILRYFTFNIFWKAGRHFEKYEWQNVCAFQVQGSKTTHWDISKDFSRDYVAWLKEYLYLNDKMRDQWNAWACNTDYETTVVENCNQIHKGLWLCTQVQGTQRYIQRIHQGHLPRPQKWLSFQEIFAMTFNITFLQKTNLKNSLQLEHFLR